MFKQWEEQDQRAQKVKDDQRALREFLRVQNEESKTRKLLERKQLVDEYVKITANISAMKVPPLRPRHFEASC